ncbi:NYN domain-containing protein [Conchiformibius kuhniae]|uniref:NYN domain-containing protein n=1 Tax=Conchiformibius kuhniae TaxID=211502 RepID=A0A8T9MVS4_9NEIS|nr:NYN domain-containing protein [Conchiformibius kuhniae]UOP04508.1 NYN domain-containing protein [Conchiformibius kuhniae]
MNENKKYAIFIDGDNISPRYLEPILSEVAKDGEILVRRIYGDWTTNNMNGWKELLLHIPVRPVQQFRNASQATDHAIVMDAIELANTNKEINAMCIVSSDKGFYSLALKIREYGLFVLGIGEQKSNSLWIKSCNQFKHIENLAVYRTTKPADAAAAAREDGHDVSLEDLLANAYANSQTDDGGRVSLSHLGKSIRNIMPDFDPRNYNHETLRAIIEAMPEHYELTKDELVPPNYWLRKIQNRAGETEKLSGTIKRWINNYGFIKTDKGDFFFYASNIDKNSRQHQIKRGDRVAFDVFKYPDPNSSNSAEQNGRAANVVFLEDEHLPVA